MEKKPLNKITVSELVRLCGVNRNTFYYHFEDIYALLKWTLEQETVEVIRHFDLLIDYDEALLFVLNYVKQNRHILVCAYDSLGRENLKRFLHDNFFAVIGSVVDSEEAKLGIRVDPEYKAFVTSFYMEALLGILINFLSDTAQTDTDRLIDNIVSVFRSSLPETLRAHCTPGASGTETVQGGI